MRMLRILRSQRGFTLIELVIILILIAVLAGVAIPRFVNLRGEAINAKAKSIQDGMRASISLDFADDVLTAGTYTPPAGLCAAPCNQPNDAGLTNLHNLMESSPNYPPAGAYDATFSTGFWWFIEFAGDANNPVRLYGLYNGTRVDNL